MSIDATSERGALVPDAFRAVQWTKLPGGEASSAFCSRVTKLLGVQCSTGVPPVAGNHGQDARAATEPVGRGLRARLIWAAGATLAVLLGVLGWSQMKPKATVVAPSESSARRCAPPTPEKAPAIKDNSLVVLPLENLSPDPENAFFTDGIHSEIIETPTRLSDLKVIRRGSALAFKDSTAPLAEIAQKLGVANVITGSVRW